RDVASVASALGDLAASVQPSWNRNFTVTAGNVHDYVQVAPDGSYHTDALQMSEGRKISDDDVASAARVCVITQDLAKEFFGNGPAVGNYLRINGGLYQVVGVYADIKGSFFNSIAGSSTVILPYSTYHNDLENGPLDFLVIYPTDPLHADAAAKAAVAQLQ